MITKLLESKVVHAQAIKAGYDKKKEVLDSFDDKKDAVIMNMFVKSKIDGVIKDEIIKSKYEEIKKRAAEQYASAGQ